MNLIRSFFIAFSMYSKIPMPRTDWTKESMRYAMCFFPVIGAVIGACFIFGIYLTGDSTGSLFPGRCGGFDPYYYHGRHSSGWSSGYGGRFEFL